MRIAAFFIFSINFLSTVSLAQSTTKPSKKEVRTLIVFFDGLRPDYIMEDYMPNLFAFKKAGSYGAQHHSVFPTVTRVNSSSYATGCYPAKSGLMGNTVYFPQVNSTKGLNTGEAENLQTINKATNGQLLTTKSLGELLASAGKRMMVFSSGSSGQAFLQNHTLSGGAIVNTSIILPASFKKEVLSAIGPIPSKQKPNSAQHKWVTEALIHFGLASDGPTVSAIWFSDPDGAAHSDGIGSQAAMASIKSVDEQFGRILSTLNQAGKTDSFNIIVSTDHGFVTSVGKDNVAGFLIKEGLKQSPTSEEVVVAEGAIYVKDHDKTVVKQIVEKLQAQPWVGAIFTHAQTTGSMKGEVEGTLSFNAIHWNHPTRAADILVDENWNDDANAAGFKGSGFSRGVAGHGGISPYEVHIPLIAYGPAFKKKFESNLPTSNVDIAATVLALQNLPIPDTMDGRPFTELMVGKTSNLKAVQVKTVVTTKLAGTIYQLTLNRTVVGKYTYVNFATTERLPVVALGK